MLTYILWFICKFRFASSFWVCYHFSYFVPLSSLHFFLTLQHPMQKQAGCYSHTEHGSHSRRTTRQLGFVPGSEAMRLCACLCFPRPQLLSISRLTVLPSGTWTSLMTWWALLQAWLQALLCFLNRCRAFLVPLFHRSETLCSQLPPSMQRTSFGPWSPFCNSLLWSSTEMLTSCLRLFMSIFLFPLPFYPGEVSLEQR